jgi:NTP pyrophosphatase (non-canonical NTP hydrolase)|tara:strand:+ start:564 stop:947 length:384 start_codon:yes stop_codon:yes gene_type:complete
MDLQLEAEQWMKEKKMSTITAAVYQEKACETAIFPKNKAMEYLTLGLTGEAGEIANKVKKFIRDGAAQDEYLAKRIEIGYEIGDVLWYCAVLAEELDMNLGHIMENNLQKLADRKKRGTLSGSGDNR